MLYELEKNGDHFLDEDVDEPREVDDKLVESEKGDELDEEEDDGDVHDDSEYELEEGLLEW